MRITANHPCDTGQNARNQQLNYAIQKVYTDTSACASPTVCDTEHLTFSTDYRTGDSQIAAQPSAYVHTDN